MSGCKNSNRRPWPADLLPPSCSPPQAEPEPHANSPPPYDGYPNSCRAFLSQCSLVFALQPRRYIMEETQVAFVITLLKACDWATAMWNARAPFCATFHDFQAEMIKLFDDLLRVTAASQLVRLNQNGGSVTDFSIQFGTLAAACDWKEAPLRSRFREGLDNEIQEEILLPNCLVILTPSWNWLCV